MPLMTTMAVGQADGSTPMSAVPMSGAAAGVSMQPSLAPGALSDRDAERASLALSDGFVADVLSELPLSAVMGEAGAVAMGVTASGTLPSLGPPSRGELTDDRLRTMSTSAISDGGLAILEAVKLGSLDDIVSSMNAGVRAPTADGGVGDGGGGGGGGDGAGGSGTRPSSAAVPVANAGHESPSDTASSTDASTGAPRSAGYPELPSSNAS